MLLSLGGGGLMIFKFLHAVKVKIDWYIEVLAGDPVHPVVVILPWETGQHLMKGQSNMILWFRG